MSLQNQISKVELAKRINDFYTFCGYEITKSQIIELSAIITNTWTELTCDIFDIFIYRAKIGSLGMIYKSPVSFMVAFNQFIKSYPIVKVCDENGNKIERDIEGYGKRIADNE